MKPSKILLLVFFAVMISGGFYISDISSQVIDLGEIKQITEEPQDKSGITMDRPKVTIHVVLRDADGNLVGYAQGHEWYKIRPWLLNPILDTKPVTEIIEMYGNKYEKISFYHKKEKLVRDHSYAGYILWSFDGKGGKTSALFMNHDAYQSKRGDTIEVYYTFIRPAK